jgi:transposase
MARPVKLTDEITERIAMLIRAGNTVEIAAAATGISQATFYAWMERGSRDGRSDARFREFRDTVETARNDAEAILVTRIAKAASGGSWSAAAWLLERRFPERWDKTAKESDGQALDQLAARREAAR